MAANRLAFIFVFFAIHPLLWASSDLQTLIDQAPESTTLELKPGVYKGNFVISKPLRITSKGKAILDGEGEGTVLKVEAEGVHISHLTIRNSGQSLGNENAGLHIENSPNASIENVRFENVLYGIRVLASPHVSIKNSFISGKEFELGRRGDGIKVWYSPHALLKGNHIEKVRDVLIWYSDHSKVLDNRFYENRYGIHYMYSHNNIAANNIIKDNSVGIYNMYSHALIISGNQLIHNRGPSGYGFAAKESNEIKILDNIIIGNREGIHMDNSPLHPADSEEKKSMVQGNLVAFNDIGLSFIGQGQWLYLQRNDFHENWQQVRSNGFNQVLSEWKENYWSDYQGFDLNKDGFGDIDYKSVSLLDTLVDQKVSLQVLRFSPVMLALQFSEKVFPWLSVKPRFVDKEPRLTAYKSTHQKNLKFSFSLFFISIILLICIIAIMLRIKI